MKAVSREAETKPHHSNVRTESAKITERKTTIAGREKQQYTDKGCNTEQVFLQTFLVI